MEAIMYVAGLASRLGDAAAGRNKVLLEFQGKSLLERHVMFLAELGVRQLHVVTGHLRENLQAAFPLLRQRYGMAFTEWYNPAFREGSVLSMHASLPTLRHASAPVLLMDGDVLYDGRMLHRLVHSPHRTALLVDREFSTADDDPVLVPMRDGQPFDFVKRWSGQADSVGESVGFFKIDPADIPFMIRETEARTDAARRGDSYDDVLREMVRSGLFGAEDVTGLPWTEIDFPKDLAYATSSILPQLEK